MNTPIANAEFAHFVDILSDMVCQYIEANPETLSSEDADDRAA
ncbi:hypothetical protein [Saccharibacillus kuerlensis]|uniref:Uncharacterized protein n=1 Tax=Saccharibacillus kuerlensis TaxID=459527 RepID=A0ABQ2KWJ0_9BACL|nr:hypothetical protein [Saccharibacillus kuerlensis]GGN95019.1 hypothetical protein GCM10010969_10320 [Saccharibacillus kuerlensis]